MTATAPAGPVSSMEPVSSAEPVELVEPVGSVGSVGSESESRVVGAVLALLGAEHGKQQPWAGDEVEYARAELVRACRIHGGQPTWATVLETLALDWAMQPPESERRECGESLLGMLAALIVPEPGEPAPVLIGPAPDDEPLRAHPDDVSSSTGDAGTSVLTVMQTKVLTLAAQGLTNERIGARLYITRDTVSTHMRALLMRLGARDRAHAVALALHHGLIPAVTRAVSR